MAPAYRFLCHLSALRHTISPELWHPSPTELKRGHPASHATLWVMYSLRDVSSRYRAWSADMKHRSSYESCWRSSSARRPWPPRRNKLAWRLAPVAGPGSDRPVERGRAPATMAALGSAALWSASNLGAGYGSVAIKGDRIFVQSSNGKQRSCEPEPRRRKGDLVESAGPRGQQRQGIGSARDADNGRRPALRPDRGRRPVVFESCGWGGRLAAQHSQGVQRPEHPVAAQRIAARRRQHGDRHAGRPERRHGGARQCRVRPAPRRS